MLHNQMNSSLNRILNRVYLNDDETRNTQSMFIDGNGINITQNDNVSYPNMYNYTNPFNRMYQSQAQPQTMPPPVPHVPPRNAAGIGPGTGTAGAAGAAAAATAAAINSTTMRPMNRPFILTRTFNTAEQPFSDVPVFPTLEQINANTTMIQYHESDSHINTTCPIRNEPFRENDIVTRINSCNHIFFPNELSVWFRQHVRCPLCRGDVRENSNTTRDTTSNTTSNTTRDTTSNTTRETNENTMNDNIISTNTITHTSNNNNNDNDNNNDNILNDFNITHLNNQTLHENNDVSFSSASNVTQNEANMFESLSFNIANNILSQLENGPEPIDISGFQLSMSFVTDNTNTQSNL